MKQLFWLSLVATILLLVGCGTQSDKSIVPEAAPPAPAEVKMLEQTVDRAEAEPVASDVTRKVIKEGRLDFRTTDMDETRKLLNAAISKHGAYVSKDREHRYGNRVEQHIVIRVPAKNFDALVEQIASAAGKVDSRSISVRDVTEEFVDVQARLRTKKELENRYHELLKKAETVKDILAIEREIGKLREEIESVEGRLKYLQDRVSFSILRVTYYQNISTLKGLTITKLKSGFSTGWNNLMSFLLGVLNIWPFIIIVVAGYLLIRRYRRRKREAKAAGA